MCETFYALSDHGIIELDNNADVRGMHAIDLERKNYPLSAPKRAAKTPHSPTS